MMDDKAESIVGVAVKGRSKTSEYIISWALNNFVPAGMVCFYLLHISPEITKIKNRMGKLVPIALASNDEAIAFRKEEEWLLTEKLLPYKDMCIRRKVQVKILQVESNDVAAAIDGEVRKHKISNLVIGASSRNFFSRGLPLSSKILERCSMYCTVYAVSEGKAPSCSSGIETSRSMREYSSEASCLSDPSSSNSLSSRTDQCSVSQFSLSHSASMPMQRFQALIALNRTLYNKKMRLPTYQAEFNDTTTRTSSFCGSLEESQLWDKGSTFSNSSENQASTTLELEKLKINIKHIEQLHAVTRISACDASRQIDELEKRRQEDEIVLKLINSKVKDAKVLVNQGKERYETAKREADLTKECAEREAEERKNVEIKVSRKSKEKENLENALMGSHYRFRNFTWEEIVSATSSFSEDLKIGAGACGTVYKCSIHYTAAAVKILHAQEAYKNKQFQQELEVLRQIRHPHFLNLLGACPEKGCLVYEYMENGSLEDRLFRKNGTPPILWFDRYRIAWEVASALVYLHSSKPKAIIHRDLKPANILLNRNFVSKIGDVGLATMVQNESFSLSTKYKDTAVVGTLWYIDPEYQRNGFVSPKSDVYAFGMVILQLLTAKPVMGLAYKIETALQNDTWKEELDAEAGTWPIEETKDLLLLALKCIEFDGKDRPDLNNEVLPMLEKLNEIAGRFRDLLSISANSPPDHFKCPILKEVMTDPCVAAYGHTYEREKIEEWLTKNDTSPVTNELLLHKNLTPNYNLLSAILEWKSG